MPLDPNIILSGRPVQFDNPLDVAAKVYNLKQLSDQSALNSQKLADDRAARDAFKSNVTTNPDGSMSLNKAGVVSSLYKSDPTKAYDLQGAFKKADQDEQVNQMEMLAKKAQMAHDLVWTIHDQPSYDNYRQQSVKLEFPNADKLPPQYDPNFVKHMQMGALTAKEQLDQFWKQKDYDQKDKENDVKRQDVGIKRQQQASAQDDKDNAAMSDYFTKGWTLRSGQAGAVQGKINAAEYAQGLIEQGKTQPGGLDSRQVEELAQNTARLLGGTAAASARVDALVPHTAFGRVQTLKEFLTNKPSGQEMQAFTNRMADTVEREKKIAEEQKREFMVSGLGKFDSYKKRSPERYNQRLSEQGLDPSMIDKNGQYIRNPFGANPHPQDSAAVEWAKQNPKDPRSAQILKLNGIGQ